MPNINQTSPATNTTAQKATVQAQYKKLIEGINTELAGESTFVIAKQSIARAALVQQFQDRIDAAEATKNARSAWRTAVEKEKALAAQVEPLRAGVKRFLQMRFGPKSNQLQDFGFTPSKAPKTTVQAKSTGVAKSKATRVARGTKGKNQKKAIKGTVPATSGGVAAGAPVTPAAPATSATPATSAGATTSATSANGANTRASTS